MKNVQNIQFISVISLILVWFASVHYGLMNQSEKVVWKMLAIEYDKVWGMENYVKLNQIQKAQIVAWLQQFEAQNGEVQPVEHNLDD